MWRNIAIGCGGLLAIVVVAMVLVAVYESTRGNNTAQQGGSSQSETSSSDQSNRGEDSSAKTQPANATKEPDPVYFSGNGQRATEPFNLQAGLAIFAGTHQGQRNFIVQLVDKGGQNEGGSVTNAIGSYNG